MYYDAPNMFGAAANSARSIIMNANKKEEIRKCKKNIERKRNEKKYTEMCQSQKNGTICKMSINKNVNAFIK